MRFAALAAALAGSSSVASGLRAQVPSTRPVDTLPWNATAGRLGSVRLGFAFLMMWDARWDAALPRVVRRRELAIGR
jgi:hypothetical protein